MHYPPAQTLRFNVASAEVTLLSGAGVLVGWALTEGSGTASVGVSIYDGPSDDDYLLATVNLTANESTRDLWAPNGIEIRNGLTVAAGGGEAFGALFAVPAEVVDAFLATQGYQPIWGGGQ